MLNFNKINFSFLPVYSLHLKIKFIDIVVQVYQLSTSVSVPCISYLPVLFHLPVIYQCICSIYQLSTSVSVPLTSYLPVYLFHIPVIYQCIGSSNQLSTSVSVPFTSYLPVYLFHLPVIYQCICSIYQFSTSVSGGGGNQSNTEPLRACSATMPLIYNLIW